MLKHTIDEDDSPSAKLQATTKCLISVLHSINDDTRCMNMCFAETDEMRDAMLLLYATLHKAIEAMLPAACADIRMKYQGTMALQVHWTHDIELQCRKRSSFQQLVTKDVLRVLVKCCKDTATPLTYLARMCRWNQEQRQLLAELMTEDIDNGDTLFLSLTEGDPPYCSLDVHLHGPLIWLQLEKGLVFFDKKNFDYCGWDHATFPHVPSRFIDYVRQYIDSKHRSYDYDFWDYKRADIRAAVASWLKSEHKAHWCV